MKTDKNEYPVVSLFLISYNNCEFIFEALDSIFEQSYCNIELVISDDCSHNFKKREIIRYIKKKKPHNIKRIKINKNHKNMGTVRHLAFLRKISNGQLITVIAADDKYCSKDAI